jgi:hypothetical protein
LKYPSGKFIITIVGFLLVALFSGCSAIAKKDASGVVIARRAQVRSSTAVVAADLLEVNRGDQVDIIDSTDVPDPNSEGAKERWYRVRAHDVENTEGWIEARNIITQELLDQSRQLGEEDKDVPAQATGQLRAVSNLRLSPDYTNNENILMKLESGAPFEIISWRRVPKPKTAEAIDNDDAPKPGSAQQRKGKKKSDDDESPKEPEEINELWYKVRLQPSISPAPSGWIYGKQVELTVPADIIFYRTGREFVAWQRLDTDADLKAAETKDKDAGKEAKPGSWVILEKSSSSEPRRVDEPDFDRIYVLGYDKYNQEHYTAYRSPDLKGRLPLRVSGKGDNKTFTVRVQGDDGQVTEAQYTVYRDDKGNLRVGSPGDTRARKKK